MEALHMSISLLQVEHMTELMLKGGRDDTDQEAPSKGNRRETWAPGLAGEAPIATADNSASPAERGLLRCLRADCHVHQQALT